MYRITQSMQADRRKQTAKSQIKPLKLCHLLITFANSLDPDQVQQNDLDANCLTLMVSLKLFFKKVDCEKMSAVEKTKSMKIYPVDK